MIIIFENLKTGGTIKKEYNLGRAEEIQGKIILLDGLHYDVKNVIPFTSHYLALITPYDKQTQKVDELTQFINENCLKCNGNEETCEALKDGRIDKCISGANYYPMNL